MNLSTIEVSPEEAEAKLAEYSKVLAGERSVEDEAIAQAYRAAKRGLRIIRLSEVIAAGGFDATGLPRLAIARALWPECHVRWYSLGGVEGLRFGDTSWPDERGALVGRHAVHVAVSEPPSSSRRGGVAPVPLVPPRYRPRRPRLANCHILWEVEGWTPEPAKDPALVRHIRGDLWAVLAVWDLTELERAVLTQRSA
jgi:hypothetical protein